MTAPANLTRPDVAKVLDEVRASGFNVRAFTFDFMRGTVRVETGEDVQDDGGFDRLDFDR